ncbi:hypothetical protein HDU92_006117 [Lobulomyces angularis]|nr:hypothetical protein HDU92_006117 [Lobulomyces angularis]
MSISIISKYQKEIEELDQELNDGDITQKGYEKKKNLILLREIEEELANGEITLKGFEKKKALLLNENILGRKPTELKKEEQQTSKVTPLEPPKHNVSKINAIHYEQKSIIPSTFTEIPPKPLKPTFVGSNSMPQQNNTENVTEPTINVFDKKNFTKISKGNQFQIDLEEMKAAKSELKSRNRGYQVVDSNDGNVQDYLSDENLNSRFSSTSDFSDLSGKVSPLENEISRAASDQDYFTTNDFTSTSPQYLFRTNTMKSHTYPSNIFPEPLECASNAFHALKSSLTTDSNEASEKIIGKQSLPTFRDEFAVNVIDEASNVPMSSFATIAAVLRFRSHLTEGMDILSIIDGKGKLMNSMTFGKLNSKASKVAQCIKEKASLAIGSNIGLIYKKGELADYVTALFGCFYAGMVAVPIVTCCVGIQEELLDIEHILEAAKISLILTTDSTLKSLTRDFITYRGQVPIKVDWWKTNEFGSFQNKKGAEEILNLYPNDVAYIEYTKSPEGLLKGIPIDHKTILSLCNTAKASNLLKGSDILFSLIEPRQQFGLVYGFFFSIFNGNTFMHSPDYISRTPGGFMKCVSKFKVTVVLSDHTSMVEILSSNIAFKQQIQSTPKKNALSYLSTLHTIFLECLFTNAPFMEEISQNFTDYGLQPRPDKLDVIIPCLALNEFGGAVLSWKDRIGDSEEFKPNNYRKSNFLSLLIEKDDLRKNIVNVKGYSGDGIADTDTILSLDASILSSIPVLNISESGFIAPGLKVAIVHPETKALLPSNFIGEIWVQGLNKFPHKYFGDDSMLRASPILFTAPSSLSEINFIKNSGDFIRTKLCGFLVSDDTLGGGKRFIHPRLFVVGMLCDRIRQRRIGGVLEDEGELLTPHLQEAPSSPMNLDTENSLTVLSKSLSFDYFFTNLLLETVMAKVSGIENCVIFNIYINGEHLPVLVYESNLAKSELHQTSRLIAKVLYDSQKIRIFLIISCAEGIIPRFKFCNNTTKKIEKTDLNTDFSGYTNGVATKLWKFTADKGKQETVSLIKTLLIAHDVNECKSLFFKGVLNSRFTWLCSGVITNIPTYERSLFEYQSKMQESKLQNKTQGVSQVWGSTYPVPLLDSQLGDFIDITEFPTICHILMWRAKFHPDLSLFSCYDFKGKESSSMTLRKFSSRVHSLAHYLMEKKELKVGEVVGISITPGIDFLIAVHACFYCGVVALPVATIDIGRVKEDMMSLFELIDEFNINTILVNQVSEELFKSKIIIGSIKNFRGGSLKEFPYLLNIQKAPKLKKEMAESDSLMLDWITAHDTKIAMIQVHYSHDMTKKTSYLSHKNMMEQCRIQAIHAKDVITTYSMLFHAIHSMKPEEFRTFSLHHLNAFMIITEGRTSKERNQLIREKFKQNRLEYSSIAPTYSPAVNPMVSTRGKIKVGITSLWLDLEALRIKKLKVLNQITENSAEAGVTQKIETIPRHLVDLSIVVEDSGQISNNTVVVIFNSEANRVCKYNEYGEIWVSSSGNVSENEKMGNDFNLVVNELNSNLRFCKTGDYGFLWPVFINNDDTHSIDVSTGNDSLRKSQTLGWEEVVHSGKDYEMVLFVLGAIKDTIEVNGLVHFLIDVENFIENCHDNIVLNSCVIFKSNHIGERGGEEKIIVTLEVKDERLTSSLIPFIIQKVLEKFKFLINQIIFFELDKLPKSRSKLKEKQRQITKFELENNAIPFLDIFAVD